MVRVTLILVTAALIVQPCQGQTLQQRVAGAQQRWAEYQELMNSSDPIARSEGFGAALADENLGVRNNALWTYLHKRDRLPIEVVLQPGDRIGPGDVPNIALSQVKWDEDQRTLGARMASFGFA